LNASYLKSFIKADIANAFSSVEFEKVSDLSKEDFEELVKAILYSVLNSPNFKSHIAKIMGFCRSVRRDQNAPFSSRDFANASNKALACSSCALVKF
jgi:hypothetical protein